MAGVPDDTRPPDPPGPEDLPGLTSGLRALYRPEAKIPPEVDESVLRAARKSARPGVRVRVAGPVLGAAAAAAVLAVVWGVWHAWPARTGGGLAADGGLPDDFNGDGIVDILDAFALARAVESGAGLTPEWDRTGDGAVTGEDADAIARVAVRIKGGSPS